MCAIRVHYGGEASLGYVLADHYFFGTPRHYIEVSRSLYQFSHWQTPAVMITQPIGMLCAMALWPRSFRARVWLEGSCACAAGASTTKI
ncbi:MAG: hypothetical protein KGJ78_02900 [Alphaproteobacteria bacterium]|nr:hypothetical protein [Alphaproteobacteria bacterium]